jgi:mRNA interferase HigB
MWIISKSRLKGFWETPLGRGAKAQLETWYQIVENASWSTFADVKRTYGAAVDLVGDCVVFDIAGNKFRLVTRIRYKTHKVYVLQVMTHGDYDKDKWKTDCGCYAEPPPMKKFIRKELIQEAEQPEPAKRPRRR